MRSSPAFRRAPRLGLTGLVLLALAYSASAEVDRTAIAEGNALYYIPTDETTIGPLLRVTIDCQVGGKMTFEPSTYSYTRTLINEGTAFSPKRTEVRTVAHTMSNGTVVNIIVRQAGEAPEFRWSVDAVSTQERDLTYDFSHLNWTEAERQQYLNSLQANQKPGHHTDPPDDVSQKNAYGVFQLGTGICQLGNGIWIPCLKFVKVPPLWVRPVLFVPGIAGCYADNPASDWQWINERGRPPTTLKIDPLAHVYDDLLQSLRNAGYVEGENLFIANYDWRMTPGPWDGNANGFIHGITPESLTDAVYSYGLDYFAYWLRRAAEAWKAKFPNAFDLESVDVISHSTGGIVVRTYLQSNAYRATFAPGRQLPAIVNNIMIAVPNQGAPKIWNPWNDNWASDRAYKLVLSKIVQRGYKRVLGGHIILGPTPGDTIDLASITGQDGQPSPEVFIHRYVPTMRALLPTYNFIVGFDSVLTSINYDPDNANNLLLDLNANLNSMFHGGDVHSVIYSETQPTTVRVEKRRGPLGWSDWDPIAEMNSYSDRDAAPNEDWYYERIEKNSGDGTVPKVSTHDLFQDRPQVQKYPIAEGDTTHTGLCSNLTVQQHVFTLLKVPPPKEFSTQPWYGNTDYPLSLSLGVDPVECYVADALGRRMGYTLATGVLNEIPNAIYLGEREGLGIVYGDLALPLTAHFKGTGDSYLVGLQLARQSVEQEFVWSGTLAAGQTRQETATLPPLGPLRINATNPLTPGGLRIGFAGTDKTVIPSLQRKSELSGLWEPDPNAVLIEAQGQSFQTTTPTGATHGFYRVVTNPAPPPTPTPCSSPPPDIASWYPGDGDANDIRGSHHGSVQNGAGFGAGRVAAAYTFDGVDDYVSVGDTLDRGAANFTIEAWIKGDPSMEAWGRIVDKGYFSGFCFGRMAGSNHVGFEFLGSGSQGNGFATTSNVIDNTWHHVAVVKAGNLVTIYADGVPENTEMVSTGSQDNGLPLLIGYNPGEGLQGHWKGQIDELTIYNRALTAVEIQAIANVGSGGKCK